MKKMLNEWKSYLKEAKEKEEILNKVRDIFFGAYSTWQPEYESFHDEKIKRLLPVISLNAQEYFEGKEDKINKVIRGAKSAISLYWSDKPNHGAGDQNMLSYVIRKKFEILEKNLSDMDKEILKNGMMDQVIDGVKKDRSNAPYPQSLAVSSGVINGKQVDDAYMTTTEAMYRFIIPMLKAKGYYKGSSEAPEKKRQTRRKYDAKMSPEEMLAQMKKLQK